MPGPPSGARSSAAALTASRTTDVRRDERDQRGVVSLVGAFGSKRAAWRPGRDTPAARPPSAPAAVCASVVAATGATLAAGASSSATIGLLIAAAKEITFLPESKGS